MVHWGNLSLIYDAELIPCGMASIVDPAAALELVKHYRDAGLDFTTLHLVDRLADSVGLSLLAEVRLALCGVDRLDNLK